MPGAHSRRPPDPLPAALSERDRLPEGAAFVLVKSAEEGRGFKGVSPFALKAELDRVLGQVHTARVLRSGAVLIKVMHRAQGLTALNIQRFLNQAVHTCPADKMNSTEARIFAPSLAKVSEEEILEGLASQGAIQVQRLRNRNGRSHPALLKVTFRGLRCPSAVYAGYEVIPTTRWLRNPLLCRRCGRYGHHKSTCRSKDVHCVSCSGLHLVDECDAPEPFCLHCGGPHPAWSRECEAWLYHRAKANPGIHDDVVTADYHRASFPPLSVTYADAARGNRQGTRRSPAPARERATGANGPAMTAEAQPRPEPAAIADEQPHSETAPSGRPATRASSPVAEARAPTPERRVPAAEADTGASATLGEPAPTSEPRIEEDVPTAETPAPHSEERAPAAERATDAEAAEAAADKQWLDDSMSATDCMSDNSDTSDTTQASDVEKRLTRAAARALDTQ